jgi:hypothetical protein
MACPQGPEYLRYFHWIARIRLPAGTVLDVSQQTSVCRATPPDGLSLEQVTPGLVADAMRHIGLTAGVLDVTPSPTTLVAYPTTVRVQVAPYDTTLTLLGQQVLVHATPARVVVDFGDGATATLSSGQSVDHTYTQAGRLAVTAHVTWVGQFRVGGTSGWTAVPGTVPITGDSVPLAVREAAAQLVAG